MSNEVRLEAARLGVLARGWRRVVLLGAPADMEGSQLRRRLAASGVLVLVPGAADRAWIGEMLERGHIDEEWLATMLAHGLEHGADGVLVTDALLAHAVASLELAVPLFFPDET